MSIDKELLKRSEGKCELCGSADEVGQYTVLPEEIASNEIAICSVCRCQVEDKSAMDVNHWRCLNESMWSTVPAVQVMAWRLLHRLYEHGWPQDLLDMLYLDEDTLKWAQAEGDGAIEEETEQYMDSNGTQLNAGDTVVLIKDLNVKGAGFTAKRGTAVRNIILSQNDPTHIEGKVNGQHIYILTKYVKKN